MERIARDGAVGHGVIAFEHRDLVGLLLGKPVPLVLGTVGEAGGLADAVVVDPVVGDVRLVGEGGPGAEDEGKLLDRLHRLGEIDRHEPPRHLFVGLFLRVVLLATEVAQVLGEQLAAAHAAAVVVQVVVHEGGVTGVHTRVLVVLVFRAVARVVLVEDVVVVDQRIGRVREELEQELLDLGVEHALHLRRIVEVRALGLEVRQRDTEPVHAFGALGREARVVLADAPRVAHHLREPEVPLPAVLLVLAQDRRHVGTRRVAPDSVGRNDGLGGPLVDGIGQRQRHAAFGGLDGVVPADVVRTLVGSPETEAPLCLDRGPRWRVVDHVGNALALALSDLGERILERLGGARIAIPVERHVGQAAVRSDRRRLPCRALERRHIGRRNPLRLRCDVVVGELELAHGAPPFVRPHRGTPGLHFPDA